MCFSNLIQIDILNPETMLRGESIIKFCYILIVTGNYFSYTGKPWLFVGDQRFIAVQFGIVVFFMLVDKIDSVLDGNVGKLSK